MRKTTYKRNTFYSLSKTRAGKNIIRHIRAPGFIRLKINTITGAEL